MNWSRLGRNRQLPVIHDLGSGALVDFKGFGIPDEPLVHNSIAAGADVVLFSGDKLLGGPQCGMVVGRQERIESLRRHPLMRAFRVGKLTLAALEATLTLYRRPATAEQEIPLLSLVSTSTANLQHRAERLAPQLAACPAIRSAEAWPANRNWAVGRHPTGHCPPGASWSLPPISVSISWHDNYDWDIRPSWPAFSATSCGSIFVPSFPSRISRWSLHFQNLSPPATSADPSRSDPASDASRPTGECSDATAPTG